MNTEATRLAAGQDGLLIHSRLRDCGYSNKRIKHLVNAGYLRRLERELYVIAGAPTTHRQEIRAAVLAAGPDAGASFESAAEVWGIPGFSNRPVEVSSPYGCDHEFKLGKLHQSCLLPGEHLTVVDGITVTCPARMLFDLAAVLGWQRLERAANSALALKLVTVVDLRRMLTELGKRGRKGTRKFRLLVEKLERARGHPESGLEGDFLILVTDHGLPEPRLQVDKFDDDGFIGRVDAIWDPHLVIAEVDSDWLHTAPLDEEADALRDKRLRALGYEVVRFSEHQVRRRQQYVIRTLREKLGLVAPRRSRGG
jgi:very-short-patch-repair endonuclease